MWRGQSVQDECDQDDPVRNAPCDHISQGATRGLLAHPALTFLSVDSLDIDRLIHDQATISICASGGVKVSMWLFRLCVGRCDICLQVCAGTSNLQRADNRL